MIEVILDDLTRIEVDAVVNSANKSLLSGSGLSGAIHKAAGYELEIECRKLCPIEEGELVVTKGYALKSKNIIHTMAPKYYLLDENREKLLRKSYYTSLKLAHENNFKIIAYPAIGIGICELPTILRVVASKPEFTRLS